MTLDQLLKDWERIWPKSKNMAEAYVAITNLIPDIHEDGLKDPISIQKYCNELVRHFDVYEDQSLGCIKVALHLKELTGGRIQYDSNHAIILAHGKHFDLMGMREEDFRFKTGSDHVYELDNFLDESAFGEQFFENIISRDENYFESNAIGADGDVVPEGESTD